MKRLPLCIALLAALLAPDITAQPAPVPVREPLPDPRGDRIEYEIELGAEISDNRARTRPASDAGLSLVPRAMFWLFHHSTRLETRAIGQLEHYQRVGSDFGNDLQVRLAAVADWAILPQRLYWTFQDVADVVPINVLAADSPDNRQQTNTFVTGPTLRLRPDAVWGAEFDARYAMTWADETETFDGDRVRGAARLNFAPRPHRKFSLGVEATDVDYSSDSASVSDHERVDASLRFENRMRRLAIELAVGRTRIDFDDGQRLEGPLQRVALRWMFNEDHQIVARAVREFSDAASELIGSIDDFQPLRADRGDPEVRPELYRLEGAELQWISRWRSSDWSLTPYVRDYDYPFEEEPLSHRARGVHLGGSYRINASNLLRGEAQFEDRQYDAGFEDRDRLLGVFFERELNTRWSFRAGVQHRERDSNRPIGGANYTDNIVSVAMVLKGGR